MLCNRASIHAQDTLAISPSEKACVNLSAVGVFMSAQHLPMFHSPGASKRASHMSNFELFQRHLRMSLRPEQHSHIAAAYDAFDISLPAHTRAAFARKADWFRLLARVGEKREQAALMAREANPIAESALQNPFGFIAEPTTALRLAIALGHWVKTDIWVPATKVRSPFKSGHCSAPRRRIYMSTGPN
jgi:hypothetical protein